MTTILPLRFSLLGLIERSAAYLQGKGYGAVSIANEIKSVHAQLRKPARLAIDIGGNVGEYAAALRARNPTLEIHVFEPSPTNIEKLADRFRKDTNVYLNPYAVSDVSGSAVLYANQPGSTLGSLTRRRLDHFGIAFDAAESVNTIRFEEYWLERLGRRRMDIVKIDIEGHELAALRGFGSALRETSVVQFEFGGSDIDTRCYFQDFWYFFQDQGFALHRITPLGLQHIRRYRESDEYFGATNYIAVNRDVTAVVT